MIKTKWKKASSLLLGTALLFLFSWNTAAAGKLVELEDSSFMKGIGPFAPGLSFETDITVENVSSDDIEYALTLQREEEEKQHREKESSMFFENLQVTVQADGNQKYEGSFAGVDTIDMGMLEEDEDLPVTFVVHFPEESGNEYQGLSASVSVKVDARQVNAPPEDDEDSDTDDNGGGGNDSGGGSGNPDSDTGDPGDTGNPGGSDDPQTPSSPNPDTGEPEQPDTGEPAAPDQPVEEPDNPDNPESPGSPAAPDDPDVPDTEDPNEPEEPGDDETVVPGGNDRPGPTLPQTGEHGDLLFYAAGLASIAVGIYLYGRVSSLAVPFMFRRRREP
ncbi:LPXTG cell wall anchor domain-containing protein [Salibacterium lacus]|uniref:LPXTG cell wall anchor domain-containing protein n=1 Tax=Salibacterium lacus TaxID=1898109 RepID=A0ABW5T5S1_9BACI